MRNASAFVAVLAVMVPLPALWAVRPAPQERPAGGGHGADVSAETRPSAGPAARPVDASEVPRDLSAETPDRSSGPAPRSIDASSRPGDISAETSRADTILWDLRRLRPVDPLGPFGGRVPADRPGRPAARWRAGLVPGVGTGPVAGPGAPEPYRRGAAWGLLPDERPVVHLGLKPLAPAWLDVPPPPGLDHPLLLPPGQRWVERWQEGLGQRGTPESLLHQAFRSRLDPARRLAGTREFLAPQPDSTGAARPDAPRDTARAGVVPPPTDTARAARGDPADPTDPTDPAAVDPAAADPAADTATVEGELPAFVTDYADLSMQVQVRSELGGDWSRFRPCESQFQETCSPRLIPQIRPDLLFNIQVDGTITDRLHVNVDFDQMREFDAANRINIWYEGGEDAIVKRMEVGDVDFALPPSRFLTEGVPAGNFGFQGHAQVGPWDVRGVWAEQKGDLSSRTFRLTGVGNQRRFVQEDTVVWDDADYVQGQFFFLVPPETLDRYPHVDVLNLDAGAAPPAVVPGADPVQLYRFEASPITRQQVEGYIQADATLERDGDVVTESGWFRYLQPGQDYFLHPSGLWIALRNPLSREEMLAVTYITAVGDTVGDYNPEEIYAEGGRPELRLLKASGALHQPGRATWEMEMHNVYRVSGSADVEPPSVGVTISLGELSAGRTFVRSPTGEDITYLRLLGLDQESPRDVVDPGWVYSPGRDAFQDQPPVQGTFIVFPTLEPFRAPPPLPDLGLTAEDTQELLGDDRNERIYENPDPFERENGGVFRLTIPFRVRSEGVISSFSLGALGIRDGSERIFLADRLLVRGVDYEIDYDQGQVRLLSPEALFAAAPEAAVRATWEQKQIFQTTPVSVVGLSGHSRMGRRGSVDVVGLYRTEKTLVNRPTLGLEPGAIGVAGMSARFDADIDWLDRLLGSVPGLRTSGSSLLAVDGEVAATLPDPNTRDAVFLDDFDASNERPLSLLAHEWTRGSAPEHSDGAEGVLPPTADPSRLARTTWQHSWIQEGVVGDSIHEGFLPRDEIDQQIRVAGTQVREPGLRLTFGRTSFDEPRWFSLTTTLSPTGADLTKSEFLEVYVDGGESATLILDLGVVSEDAFFVAPNGTTGGTRVNGIPWGLGVLDQEASPRRGEIWGTEADGRGLWPEDCEGEPGRLYPEGDPRANCTRNNGRNDSEDLDGDGNLDTREHHLRYVLELDGTSPYLARTRVETNTDFRLYRIPISGPGALEVGGPFTDADLRAVKQLRITAVAPRRETLTLARMRIIGSRWIKRTEEGVLRGIGGDTVALAGRLEVTPVSRLTEGDAYESPPGVLEELSDPTSQFGAQGLEFNEKSLALRFEDVQSGDRAEVYHRFPQRPRNFLSYRQARLWVVARSGDFDPERPTYFTFKLGSDSENFYLFRTTLPAPPGGGGVRTPDWLPEVVVDFGEWLELRRRAEQSLIREPRSSGDPPLVLWSRDSTHAVVLKDRGRAPDLANVREMAVGVWNGGEGPVQGEVWVDELRLSAAVTNAGVASHLNVTLDAADVLQTRASWSSRGANFRELDEEPTYQDDRVLSLSSRLSLERFLPADWGVELPLRLTHDRADRDPLFLANSDVRADRLQGLRSTGTRRTRVSLGLRKTTPTQDPVLSVLLDGLSADVGWFRSSASTVASQLESQGLDTRLGYDRRLAPRTVGLLPTFLDGLLDFLLPGGVAEGLADARFRWSPERISVGTGYLRQDNDILRFERIIAGPEDSLVTATRAPRESMETVAEVAFRFFDPLTAEITFLSTRDLLDPEEAVQERDVQNLLADQRSSLAGVDLGWETNRTVRTRFDFRPRPTSWLRPDLAWSTRYLSDRNTSFIERRPSGIPGDTTIILQRNASGDRSMQVSLWWDPSGMGDAVLGDRDGGVERAGRTFLGRLLPTTLSWTEGLNSRFHRDPVAPGLGYQLGWGGIDRFRILGRDTAATLTDREAWRLASGVRLREGMELAVGYGVDDIGILDSRSNRTVHTRTWPDLRLEASATDGIEGTPLDRLSASIGWEATVRETELGGPSRQRRVEQGDRLPVDLRFGWAGAATFAYVGSFRISEGIDPTGDTERDGQTHSLSFSSSFLPPLGLEEQFDRPMSLSVIWSYDSDRECRVARRREDCVAFLDQRTRALSLTLNSGIQGFEVGLQTSYTDRQSFVGQRQGSTQIQLGLFGQFLFQAGRPPAVFEPG